MGFNILIVDDSLSIRKIIKRIIQISGFDVNQLYEAKNGKEAFDILKNNWIDVVLTDINMPEMDGLTLLKKIRNDDTLKGLPVIIVSTEARDKKIEESLKLGANGYIKKPFKPEEIKNVLINIMGLEYVREGAEEFSF